MSENSRNLTASGPNNVQGPDFFGFYTSEAVELLSQDNDFLNFPIDVSDLVGSPRSQMSEKGSCKNSSRTQENNDICGSDSLFSNGVGALLSEPKRERLKSLLRQSVLTLTQEVDEMINPVLSVCKIRSCLECKENLLGLDASAQKDDQTQHPHKKAKIDDDLRFILENDTSKVEELLKKHAGELSATLYHMENKLEELLNVVLTTCRPMTITEKQHLCQLIEKLQPKSLDRVVEIIGNNKLPSSLDELRVDLDEEDNTALWRLYFYVKTSQATKGREVANDDDNEN